MTISYGPSDALLPPKMLKPREPKVEEPQIPTPPPIPGYGDWVLVNGKGPYQVTERNWIDEEHVYEVAFDLRRYVVPERWLTLVTQDSLSIEVFF